MSDDETEEWSVSVPFQWVTTSDTESSLQHQRGEILTNRLMELNTTSDDDSSDEATGPGSEGGYVENPYAHPSEQVRDLTSGYWLKSLKTSVIGSVIFLTGILSFLGYLAVQSPILIIAATGSLLLHFLTRVFAVIYLYRDTKEITQASEILPIVNKSDWEAPRWYPFGGMWAFILLTSPPFFEFGFFLVYILRRRYKMGVP